MNFWENLGDLEESGLGYEGNFWKTWGELEQEILEYEGKFWDNLEVKLGYEGSLWEELTKRGAGDGWENFTPMEFLGEFCSAVC